MSTFYQYLPAIFSSLFRICSYIFLRVIPTRLARPVLPTLYILYLVSLWFFSPSSRPHPKTGYSEDDKRNPPPQEASYDDPVLTLLFSFPSRLRWLQLVNILLNALLLGAAADFAFTPFFDTASDVMFTRIGAVYPDSIKIAARYPQPNITNTETLRVIFRELKVPSELPTWKDGPLMTFHNDNDWVDTVSLGSLWPNTSYEYAFATLNRTRVVYPGTPLRFHTFPDPRLPTGNHFRFIVSSCVTPNHPYSGPIYRNRIKGFDLLADYLFPPTTGQHPELLGNHAPSLGDASINASPTRAPTTSPPAEFLLFLGDFIYADVPIYIGDDKEAYRRLYRRNYQSPSYRKIYEHLPVIHAYDDHEFINNFGANGNDSTPPFPNAADAFTIYNSNANYESLTPGKYYFEFHYGDAAFFVMDTRRYRSNESSNTTRSMLGDEQLHALLEWLGRVNGTSTFKFIATSVPFTSLWGHDAQIDSWAGFPEEKAILLEAFHSVPNVIILSGDRHEFAGIEFSSVNADLHEVREFSTSPMSMFYIPFFRTLRMHSESTVQRNYTRFNDMGTGPESYTEDIPTETVLKYIPTGNYKWSAFEIDTRNAEKPSLRLEVMIDGKPGYHYELVGKPAKAQPSRALGAFVPSGIKDIFKKFGVNPSGWF
ncbi:PhoD-like phosphatase-domain-containing protein [Collybia nuda]|uniref:PhoD-like phosphatase-domain-containing protein n=1 Tax=Collybia nuda TaxID=64659 RepID=A0A9P6CEV8_9AGAR|nr:PhoD-like phosphatase-domain-containing protein [Collybia nuda]